MKTNTERQADMRLRRAALGQYRREYFLTDAEAPKVARYIKKMRRARGVNAGQ